MFLNKFFKEIIFLISSLLLLICSLLYIFFYNSSEASFQFLIELNWFESYYLLGIDSILILFLFLTTFIMPLCLLFNWNLDKGLNEQFYFFFILLFLEILLILVFLILELIFFYIVFEFLLIPFYFIIVLNNKQSFYRNLNIINKKMNAFFLLFFYTIFGSLLMLMGILIIYINLGTTLIPIVWYAKLNLNLEYLLWCLFFVSFSVKIPILPVHLWLPEAHVESPTEGSVILAAILLKIGLYGLIRILIPCFQEATIYFSLVVWLLCIFSVIYTSMTACVQVDIKRIIAYASIGHMNICVLGLFSLDISSILGSVILMFSHGLASAGLFFVIGILYHKFHTKNIKYYNGIVSVMPLISICFFLFIVSNFGMPGTLNFIGEFFIFTSFFKNSIFSIYVCIFASILLCSFYSIYLYNHIVFGNNNRFFYYFVSDINIIEFFILIVLIVFIFLPGLYPFFICDWLKLDLHYYFYYYII